MRERLRAVLDSFPGDPKAGLQALRALLAEDREQFRPAALESLIQEASDSPANQALVRVMAERGLLEEVLCNPALLTRERAIEIARLGMQAEPLLDAKLARRLQDLAGEPAERVLAILDAVGAGARITSILRSVVRQPDRRLRSKATLLVGRANRNPQWLEQQMREADPRVRANAVEALWGVNSEEVRSIFLRAAFDPDPRVAVNALVGLHRLGDPACFAGFARLARRAAARDRASAAWGMGETRDPRFLPLLGSMDPEPPEGVGRNIARAVERIEAARTRPQRFTIRLLRREGRDGGWRRAQVAVVGQPWEPIHLAPTQFVLWADEQPVENYDVRRQEQDRALIVGFVLCSGLDLSEPDTDAARTALLSCLDHKRPADLWAPIRHFDEPIRFATDRPALRKALQPGDRSPQAGSARQDVLTRTLERAAVLRGDRHLVVLAGPQGLPAGISPLGPVDAAHIAAAAQQAKCAVHGLVLGQPAPGHPLAELSQQTGGMLLESPASQLTEALQQLLTGLLNRYEIQWSAPASPASLRIEIFSESGRGEITLPAG